MSACESAWEEKRLLDRLLEEERSILDVREDLDGTVVRFSAPVAGSGRHASSPCLIRLQSADARKYVANLVILQIHAAEL
ncbi:hypothetical protein [Paenibacillus humicus]|uniref:hypothetical protein n=1 Tax=Paenibacillus humicus TaxID=412861 RepID=UPI000FD8BB23|nr:hypothetical protein [Paenibacillus humicus]